MISIVIPVYNEESNIVPLYEKLKQVMGQFDEYEIIFVDDGSNDNTFEEIKKLHKKNKKIKCISMKRNFGQTPALMAGFEHSKGDIVITMDGDLQNDPDDIPKLVQKLNEFDVVSGWRYERKDKIGKKMASRISNWFAQRFTSLKIHDFGCTLKAYKKECIKDLEMYGEMHRYIPAVAAWKGYKVGEVKVKHYARERGESKYGFSRLFRGFFDLINFKFWAGYSTRPLHLFGGIGLLLFIAGFFVDLYLVILKIVYGESLSDRPLLLLGVLLMVVGFQIFMTGFLAEIMIRNYYAVSHKKSYVIEKKLE